MKFRNNGNLPTDVTLLGDRIGRADPCCGPLCADPVRWQTAMICDAGLSVVPEGLYSADGESKIKRNEV